MSISSVIQGDLQRVFDALYKMGIIDPVLQLDWVEVMNNRNEFYSHLQPILAVVNHTNGDCEVLVNALKEFDQKSLGFLAMEVAREFADFHARKELH